MACRIHHLMPGDTSSRIAYDCHCYRIGYQVLHQGLAYRGTEDLQIEPACRALRLGSLFRCRADQGRSRVISYRYSQNCFQKAVVVKEESCNESGRPETTLNRIEQDCRSPSGTVS